MAGTSPGMVRALVQQVEQEAADLDFADVVPARPLLRLSVVASVIIVAVFAVVASHGRTGWSFVQRALLVPGVAYPHRTRITVAVGDVTVAKGDPVTLSATVAGDVPATGVVRATYAGGGTVEVPTEVTGNRFDRAIDNVQAPFAYRFAIGDDQSDEFHVTTATRPAVLGVKCRVVPPAYTGLPAADRSPWDLTMLAGSRLGLGVTPNVACAGEVRFIGAELTLPLVDEGDGLTFPPTTVPATATAFTIDLTSPDGLRSRDPVVYKIDLTPDRPPTVRLTVPAGDVTVTPVAHPAVAVEADDDYGLARLSLRYRLTKAGQQLATDDDPNGLTGTYGPPQGGPGVSRVDPTIDASWAATPPPAGVAGPFAVRWVGSVRPMVSDDYRFMVRSTGVCRVTVARRTLIDRLGQGEEGPVHMVAGRLYPIEVSTVAPADGEVRLYWRGRKVPSQIIPHNCLFRRTDAPDPPPDLDGLVGYWPMDDVGAGYVHDLVGSADGTVFDATAVPGKIGTAGAVPPAPAGRPRPVPARRTGRDAGRCRSVWTRATRWPRG